MMRAMREAASGLLILLVLPMAAAVAQDGMPKGPYSAWSEDQKQDAATYLGQHCQRPSQCGGYIASATSGTGRAAYEAAACIAACFAANLPPDYPDLDSIRKIAITNAEEARKLGSTYQPTLPPVAKPDTSPAAAPAPSK